MALGMAGCVLLLSRAVGFAYKKQYAIVSHCVLGIVCATALMIFPSRSDFGSAGELLAGLGFIVVGAVVSFVLSRACDELKKRTENQPTAFYNFFTAFAPNQTAQEDTLWNPKS